MGQYGYYDLLESCIHFFQSRLIMISLIKMSDSGPLGSLVGFKGVARLEASGSDKQPLTNHAILSKSSHDHRHNINHKKLKRLKK